MYPKELTTRSRKTTKRLNTLRDGGGAVGAPPEDEKDQKKEKINPH
jgi:hypothetical protein